MEQTEAEVSDSNDVKKTEANEAKRTEAHFSDSDEAKRVEEKKEIEHQNAQQAILELSLILNQVKKL